MKSKYLMIFFFVFCKTINNVSYSDPLNGFAYYRDLHCSYSKIKGCFIEKYISYDGFRIGISIEKNEPKTSSIKIWKDSAIFYLQESGYKIIENTKINNFEYIVSKVFLKEEEYVYGIAMQMKTQNEIILVEFAGSIDQYKNYKNVVISILERLNKKFSITIVPLIKISYIL